MTAACGAIGDVASIEKEGILIAPRSGDLTTCIVALSTCSRRSDCVEARSCEGLQEQKRSSVPGECRDCVEHFPVEHVAHRGIHCLQFDAGVRLHFNNLRYRSDFELRIYGS